MHSGEGKNTYYTSRWAYEFIYSVPYPLRWGYGFIFSGDGMASSFPQVKVLIHFLGYSSLLMKVKVPVIDPGDIWIYLYSPHHWGEGMGLIIKLFYSYTSSRLGNIWNMEGLARYLLLVSDPEKKHLKNDTFYVKCVTTLTWNAPDMSKVGPIPEWDT